MNLGERVDAERTNGSLPKMMRSAVTALPSVKESEKFAAGNAAKPAWHALSGSEVLKHLNGAPHGLSASEVENRLARFGANTMSDSKSRPAWLRFLLQFRSVLLYVLMGSAIVTALLGYWIDSCVILGVVLINAVIGFVQEDHAERALDGIKELLSPESRVIRGGNPHMIDSRNLVPGDIIVLREGDRVGADCRILNADGLQTDESMLTGESFPVGKSAAHCATDAELADRACIAYAGTLVAAGRGRGVVIETGNRTELGKITASLSEARTPPAPIIVQMSQFASRMTVALLALSAALLAFATLIRKMPPAEALLATVAFAVGAIPEGLPAILTITLAAGVARMAPNAGIRDSIGAARITVTFYPRLLSV